jgi:hypothetical protein
MSFGVVNPASGDYDDAITKFSGEGKSFDIKSPAIDLGSAEDFFGSIGRKRFEPALCIPDAGNGNELNKEIASVAQEAFNCRLRNRLPRPFRIFTVARTNDYIITVLKKRMHLVKMVDVRFLSPRIREQDPGYYQLVHPEQPGSPRRKAAAIDIRRQTIESS